jgi:outer membrane protein assembly factor BamB
MNCRRLGFVVGLCIAISTSAARAARLVSLPQISIVQYGGYINDVFTETYKDRQANFEVDLDKGRGFFDQRDAIFVLPVKGLNEDRLDQDAGSGQGAPVCHLLVSSGLQVLVNGKPLDTIKLRFAKGLSHAGEEKESAGFVCTARRKGGGKLELCLFGADKEPVFATPLERVQSPDSADFEAKMGNGQRALLMTFFGKYEATLSFASIEVKRHADEDLMTTQFGRAPEKTVPTRTVAHRSGHAEASGPPVSLLQLDIERTGYLRQSDSMPKAPSVIWKYPPDADANRIVPGGPVVDKGIVYFGDNGGQVHALNAADGAEKWSRSYGVQRIVAAPVVVDKMIYVATTVDVKCVSLESGRLVWSQGLPASFGETPPLIVGDVVFAAGGDGVYAFRRANGERLWKHNLVDDRPVNSPSFDSQSLLGGETSMRTQAAASDGTLLFQPIYDQCRVVTLDCKTGKRKWSYPTRGWLPSHPAVSGRYVLFGGFDLYLHCVDRETGKSVWKSPSAAEVDAAPAVANGCVYFAANNARVHCVDLETGKRIWMHRMDPEVEGVTFVCAPLVTDTAVYVGSSNGFLCALDATSGEFKWGLSLANRARISGSGLATDGKRLFAAVSPTRFPQRESGIFAVGDP